MNSGQKSFRQLWNDTCLSAGIPAISLDTAARLLAIVVVHGGSSELFSYSTSLKDDVRYLQDKYNIYGGQIPDTRLVKLMSGYVAELESYEEEHWHDKTEGGVCVIKIPEWGRKLILDRYNLKI